MAVRQLNTGLTPLWQQQHFVRLPAVRARMGTWVLRGKSLLLHQQGLHYFRAIHHCCLCLVSLSSSPSPSPSLFLVQFQTKPCQVPDGKPRWTMHGLWCASSQQLSLLLVTRKSRVDLTTPLFSHTQTHTGQQVMILVSTLPTASNTSLTLTRLQ